MLTGEVDNHPANNKYGEVHTGDAWPPARDRYCQNKTDMPVGLIVFGDKSHTDLHGALSLTPIIFTVTLFNRATQNDSKFWRPIGYIPDLGYGRGTPTRLRQEIKSKMGTLVFHPLFNHLKTSTKKMDSNVLCWDAQCVSKFGIHYFIGDTEGNNKWLGQYSGNREGVRSPYRDCKCQSRLVIPV